MAFDADLKHTGLDRIQNIEQYLATAPSLRTASLDFTDGDTLKRFTVTDGKVTAASVIHPSITRAAIADVDDPGWSYTPNVVTVAAGSFDVLVSVLAGDAPAAAGEYPNETVTLTYSVL